MSKLPKQRGRINRALCGSAAISPAVALLASPQPAFAATPLLSSTVGVCAGVSLPRNAITSIVTPIVSAGITPIESTLNAVVGGLGTLLPAALRGTTLNVDLTSAAATAGVGAILLKPIADDNNPIAANAGCFSRADGFTLTTPAGLAIGGNVISGLGDGLQPAANAGDIASIAFGNGATSDAAATASVTIGAGSTIGAAGVGAVAIGNASRVVGRNGIAIGNAAAATGANALALGGGAQASMDNSIALGAGSVTARGATAAYTGYALAAPTVSVGEVSVGAAGAARQITNLSPGVAGTDAVNVAQLTAVGTRVDGVNAAVTANTSAISGLTTRVGTGEGAIASLSTRVGTNEGDIATIKGNVSANTDAITGATAAIGGLTSRVGMAETGLAGLTTRVGIDEGDIVTLKGGVAANGTAIADATLSIGTLRDDVSNGKLGPVHYSDASTPTVPNGGTRSDDVTLVGASGGAVGLHDVADGKVAAGSTDAVNGGQLFALGNRISAIGDLAVSYDDATRGVVTFGSAGGAPVALRNVAAGRLAADSAEAVTGAQLYATDQTLGTVSTTVAGLDGRIATNETDIGTLKTDVAANTGNIAALGGAVTTNTAAIATVDTRLTGLDGRVSANETDIGMLGGQVAADAAAITAVDARVTGLAGDFGQFSLAVSNGAVGPVRYAAAATPTTPNGGIPSDDLTLVGASGGAVRLHDVAAGSVSATSTDAVNGSQLYALQSQIPGSDGLAVAYDDATRGHVTLGGVGATGPVGLSNLADARLAAGSGDAVTGSQLFATNQSIGQVSATVDGLSATVAAVDDRVIANADDIADLGGRVTTNATAIAGIDTRLTANSAMLGDLSLAVSNGAVGPVRYSDAASPTVPNGGVPSQDLTLVGAAAGVVGLHNIAAGRVAPGSTDATNGGQLASLGSAVAATLGDVTYDPASNSFSGGYQYDGKRYATVQDALDAVQAGGGTGSTIADGGGIKYFHTNSQAPDSNATGADATAIGANAAASGDGAVAMGLNASASGASAVAIGSGATAQNGMAVSIGVGNVASGDGAVSIGDPNVATGDGAVALGKDNGASGTGAVALGAANQITGDGAVALGSGNVAQGHAAIAIGYQDMVAGQNAIAIGSQIAVSGDNSLAIGNQVTTSAGDTLAIGTAAAATARSALAIGNRSSASGADAIAVGVDSVASGELASAYGQSAVAAQIYTTAIGAQSHATGTASTAIGIGATTTALGSTAIGAGATVDHANSVALGAAVETTRGAQSDYSAFGLDTAQSSNGEVAIGQNMIYTDPDTGRPTTTGARQITGVAAGSAPADAVNVAQLRGVSDTIGTALATGLGGGAGYDTATGQVTGPSYTLAGVTYGSVGDALTALASRGTGTGGTATDPAAVHYDTQTGTTLTLASGGTLVTNVAAGGVAAGSSDAVNGGQLAATNARIDATGSAVTALAQAVANGAVGPVRYADAATPAAGNGGTPTNDVALVGADAAAPVGLHNVASGTIASGSTDAVNGGQLAATNARVSTVEATAGSALAMGQNSLQYDDAGHMSVTLGDAGAGGTSGTGVALHNVADGTSARDAVNLGQLATVANQALGQSEAYTDAKVQALAFDLGKVRKDQAGGTAGALALAGMPQPYEAGRGMISAGVGAFMGQSAIALGLAKALSDEHTVVRLGATYNSRGYVGANAGIGYQF